MTTLYGVPPSPFVRKVRVALEMKKIPYDFELVIPVNVSDEYKKISPLGKVPALRIDGLAIPDSSVICAYLEKTHPTPALYPSKPADLAKALWLEEYTDTALCTTIVGHIFFPMIIEPRLLGKMPDQAAIHKAFTEELPPLCDYLEAQIQGKETILKDQFSLADVSVVSQFVNLYYCELSIDKKRWPKLAHLVEYHMEHEIFKPILEDEREFIETHA